MNEDVLLERTAEVLPELVGATSTPVEKGGSARRFFRISGDHCSAILVQDLGERTENRHYAELAAFLKGHGVPVPDVLAESPEEGLLWLEDLGTEDLWAFRNESWEIRRPLYESTLRGLAVLHRIPAEGPAVAGITLQPPFDEALYRWEQEYFAEHCLGGIFGMDPDVREILLRSPGLAGLPERLASRARRLLHRDFQSQNIMISGGNARFIDFQGLRCGLPQYDLASLLLDPYLTLSSSERESLLGFYRDDRRDAGDPVEEDFDRIFWLCAAQRLMQALGAYGFLSIHRGKPDFRAHVTPALNNLREVLKRLSGEDRLVELSAIVKDLKDSQG